MVVMICPNCSYDSQNLTFEVCPNCNYFVPNEVPPKIDPFVSNSSQNAADNRNAESHSKILDKESLSSFLHKLDSLFIQKIDSGEFFQRGFYWILKIGAFIALVVGLITIVYGFVNIFDDSLRYRYNRLSGMAKFSAVFVLIVGASGIVSIFLLLSKRSKQLINSEYLGMTDIFLRIFRVSAEVIAISIVVYAVSGFIATMIAGAQGADVAAFVLVKSQSQLYNKVFVEAFRADKALLVRLGSVVFLFSSVFFSFIILSGMYFVADIFSVIYRFFLRKTN